MVGIPRYRLPREVIDREVAMIESLGVAFCFNTRFGSDVTLAQLRKEGFEAFFIAIGAHAAYNLGVPGEKDFSQVIEAITFLRNVALGDRHIPGRRVVVIGGGNVAIDAARTCLRLGCEQVTLAYRRTRHEMPADEEEVEQAEEEGVRFAMLTVPVAVEGDGDQMTGLHCLQAKLVSMPGSDRKSPKPIEGSDFVMPADALISAIGQRIESHWLAEIEGLEWSRRDTIRVDTATMATPVPGIFAARGPRSQGRLPSSRPSAAESAPHRPLIVIFAVFLSPRCRRCRCVGTGWSGPKCPQTPKWYLKRPDMPLLKMDRRRTTFQQVELGYSENMVREEARRCLRCDICRRCGLCVQICRDKMGVDALSLGYLAFDHPGTTNFRQTQDLCISCGACATNCPTGAMKLEDRWQRAHSLPLRYDTEPASRWSTATDAAPCWERSDTWRIFAIGFINLRPII